MGDQNGHGEVRPRTAVLTRGFDPSLSVGSARPAVPEAVNFDQPEPCYKRKALSVEFVI